MAIVLGLNAKLLRGNAGSTANTEVKNVKDLTLNLESGEADRVHPRSGVDVRGVKQVLKAEKA